MRGTHAFTSAHPSKLACPGCWGKRLCDLHAGRWPRRRVACPVHHQHRARRVERGRARKSGGARAPGGRTHRAAQPAACERARAAFAALGSALHSRHMAARCCTRMRGCCAPGHPAATVYNSVYGAAAAAAGVLHSAERNIAHECFGSRKRYLGC